MNLKNLAQAIGFGQSRANRLKSQKTSTRRLVFNPLDYELEKRQLLATFDYNSLTGRLFVETDQNSETLSIISTSNSGNYTLTTTGAWSGSSSADVGSSGTSLFVNSTANISLIQITSNAVNSGSAFYFGTSSGNFVDDLTVNFTNSTSGQISVANATSFINGSILNLTTTGNQITVSSPLTSNSTGSINLTGRNIVVTGNINTAAGSISLIGNNGSYQSGTFDGVNISGSGVNVNTTSGNITIDGRGASNSASHGVIIGVIPTGGTLKTGGTGFINITGVSGNGSGTTGLSGIIIRHPVTTANGNISLYGISESLVTAATGVWLEYLANVSSTGTGNVNITGSSLISADGPRGIYAAPNVLVSTNSGLLTINGTVNSTGSQARGVCFTATGSISATGSGNIVISGTVLNGTDSAIGVQTGPININSGTLTITGTSNGVGADSVGINLVANITNSGAGNVNLTGRTPGNTSAGIGINHSDSSTRIYSNGGLVTLTANSVNLTGTVNATSAGNVLIQTLGAGVNLGGADSSANLGLTSSEIDQITANLLTIGNGTTGNIAVTAAISRPANGSLTLVANTTSSCISVGAALSVTGSGGLSLTGRNIVVTGNITSTAGSLSLIGNNGSYQSGTFDGVRINGSTVNVNTTSGNITIDGRSGANTINSGVNLTSSKVQAGGSGCVTITGVSGNGSSRTYGIDANGATVTTNSGSITVNGTSWGTTGANSRGVNLQSFANISATGAGNVTIIGTAANGFNSPSGIQITTSNVTTSSGSITVNGTSCGTGSCSTGVYLKTNANISATGAGNVTITGTAACGTDYARGVYVLGSNVTTSSGSLTVNGTSCGTTTSSTGVSLGTSANISATGAGNVTITGSTSLNFSNFTAISLSDAGSKIYANGGLITLNANSVNLTGTVNATTAGNVLIQTLGAGVNLGNGTDTSANLGLSLTECNQITANLLTIGNGTTGNIAVTAAISRPANGSLALITSNTSNQITVGAALSTTGTGGISLTGRNIVVTGNITTAGGDIKIYGNGGGSYQAGTFDGVCISGASVNVNTTGGSILIDGRGARGSANKGVNLASAKVQAGGSGCVTIIGVSGNGSINDTYGIYVSTGTISAANGCIVLSGTTFGTADDSHGVDLRDNPNISAGGRGCISITGNVSAGNRYGYGILTEGTSGGNITTANGSITLNGFSDALDSGSKRGLYLRKFVLISAGGIGSIEVTGVTTNSNLQPVDLSQVNLTTSGGSILIKTNGLSISSESRVNATTARNVTIQPTSNGTLINLGNGTDTNTTLGLSAAEIGQITAGTLTIGNSTAGNITVSAPIMWPTNLTLITGGAYFGASANLTVNGTLIPTFVPILVTNANDSGNGSLRDAIATASTNIGDDQISFDSNLTGSTISLLAPLTINDLSGGYLNLTGLGASNLSISGGGSTGIFAVYSPAGFSGLTLTGGTGANGASPNIQGGAIYSNSTLRLTSMTINNSTANFGSAIYQTGGSLTLTSSNIANEVYITGSGNLTVSGGLLGSNVTVASGNTVSIANYTGSSDRFSFNSNSIVLSNITASGNLTVAGNSSTSCISVTGPLSATGANSISLTGRNIVVTGNITSQAGDITLYGNGGGSYRTGTFDGVCISGSSVNVNTTSGNIVIDGRGGLNTACAGVRLASTPKVQADGSGGVTITGVSGNGSGGNACGIYVRACVTTSNGSLTINGTSNGTGTGSQGFSLDYSSQIAATNSGNVSIIGIAANGTNSACGVYSSGGCITTNSGLLVVNGVSCGTGTSTAGVHLLFGCTTANISSTGGGNVTVSGSTPGNTSTGIGINSSTFTVKIYSNGGLITLTANSLNLTGTVNATTAGNVLIQTLGAGVNLGNGTDTSANLGLSSVEIGNITANLLTIGNGTTGNIAVTAAISRPANGSMSLITSNTASNITVGFALSTTGTGGISLTGRNIVVTGNITTAVGDIKIYGNGGGSYQAGTFDGVCISGASVNVNTTGGNITIDGRGASNSTNCGVNIGGTLKTGGLGFIYITGVSGNGTSAFSQGIAIISPVTTADGNITVYGTSESAGYGATGVCFTPLGNVSSTGTGSVNITGSSLNASGDARGVMAISGSNNLFATTNTGQLTINGTANSTGSQATGVYITTTSSISATGSGNIIISGTALSATDSAIGVRAGTININSGTLTITGTSNGVGAGSVGINLGANITNTGAGNVNLTGRTPGNTSAGIGINHSDSSTRIYSNGGLITLTANSVNLTGTVNATSAGNVLIQTLGTGVNLGGSDSSANLGLSQAELNKITANLLTIGNLTTGNIILSQNINWSSNITLSSNLPTTGTLSNSNRTLTQGSNALTATGTISIVSATINYTILISSNAPVTYGTNVLLTASITHSGGAFNTGTISFYNNGVLLSTSNITNDLANYTWSGLGAASYTNITATGNITGGIDNGSNTANVVVNQANLTITANNAAKIYNASAFTGGNGVAYSGFVGSENSTALSGTLVYGGTSQNAINAGSYTITPSNLTSTNYNITFANGTLSVATANLTITANSISKTYGDSVTSQMGLQTSGYIVSGLQGLDSLTNVTLSSTGAANTVGAANYNITPSAANSTAISNYNITYTNGTLTVNRYNISVTANNQTKAYGVALPTLTFTNSPLVNGDSSSVFTGALATTATANSPGGYYPITIGTLSATPNYTISSFTNGTLSESEELTTVITTSTDSTDPYDNVVSLREAISYGTTLTGNQAVTFSSGIYTSNLSTITLTQGVLTINDNTGLMSIQGPAVSSGNLLTISGNNASGIFKVLSNATISNMTLTNGTGSSGTSPNIQGGAIYSSSTLVLSNVTIPNSTANYGSAIYQSGGVLNVNSSPISNSIYVDNSGDLIISGAQSVVLPQITAYSLSVNISGGSITQAAGSNIQVSGTASFVSSGEVILANSTNDFATLNATGTNVSISDSNSLILGTIRSNVLSVNLPSGAVSQSPGTNIVASGVASFTTSGDVTLSNATNNFATVTASGANITISDADNVNIGSIQSTGNLTITSVGTTNLSANITTTGDQLFNRPVILTNNVTLRTTANGNATFASTLNGAYTLTANLGLGSLINRGTVGSCTTLNLASVGSISGSDLNLTIAPGAVIGSITGYGSNNTITAQSLSNETSNIVISGTNSGNITSSGGTSMGSFTGITRIVGGAGSDTFKFVNNSALLNGTIDGGSGTNALNYSGTTKPTFINLGTGQATGVTSTTSTGVVTNIQNVFGGTGNDYLVGSADSNVMDGGAGDDTMSGLGGNDIMVGNYGSDNMNGGAGIDILIGGYVDFVVGNLQEGLESIMSTWNNVTDGTFNAVSNTLGTASSTQPRLVGDTNLASTYRLQTVFNDQATDRLTDIASSTTPNWFFATERVTQGNDVVLAGTTFTVSKKTVTSKTGRTAR